MTTFLKYSVFACVLLTISQTPSVARAGDPAIEWQVIETPHFNVVFDSKHYELGALYATNAERAFDAVAPSFGVWPEKTTIFLDESTDLANGLAAPLPYPMISAYPVLPTELDTISDYGNWSLELITHEYTHILTFEPANGVMKPLRWVFGNLIKPNMFLPRWYLEGLAVEMETRKSHFGRLRSRNFLSIPRAMIVDGKLTIEDLGRLNEPSIPDYLTGNRAYLFGAMVWDEIIRRGGEKMIGELNQAYSRRVPFFINGPLEDRLGVNYNQLLDEMYQRVQVIAQKQLDVIHKPGSTHGIKVEKVAGFFTHDQLISPDRKKMLFIGEEHNVTSYIDVITRDSASQSFALDSKPKRLLKPQLATKASWLPDSRAFVFDDVEDFGFYDEYSDLWRCDLNDDLKCEKKQITKGLRAREPVVSPDGRYLVFIQVTPGSTQLASVAIDGSHYSTLSVPRISTRLSRPEYISPDEIIYNEKTPDGLEILRKLELHEREDGKLEARGEAEELLNAYAPITFAHVSSEGLLFTSERSGVGNIYLANSDLTSARALTNSETRALTSELDPETGDLYVSMLTSNGFQLEVSKKSEWQKLPSEPPKVSLLNDTQYPPITDSKASPDVKHPKDYSSWPYMVPQFWEPYGFFIPQGYYVEASTAAVDPAEHQGYQVVGSYDDLTNRPSVFAQYFNHATQVPLILTGFDINQYIYSGSLDLQTVSGSLGTEFYFPGVKKDWSGTANYQYLTSSLGGIAISRGGPSVSLNWTNIKQRGFEISPESGGMFGLTYSKYIQGDGNINYEETDFQAATYISKSLFGFGWLPERHVIALMVNSSIAPRLNIPLLGVETIGGVYQSAMQQRYFVMRGYGTGEFFGNNMIEGTFEYRFPITYNYSGFGTKPFFLRRIHADIFLDALTLDGLAYNQSTDAYLSEKLGHFFYGTGFEFKFDTTVFYQAAMQIVLGLYDGTDGNANPYGAFPFVSVIF